MLSTVSFSNHSRLCPNATCGTGQGKVDLDVRLHLGRLKQEVLRDVHLCFTKLIPVGEAEPERHHLWLLANKVDFPQ